MEQVAILSEWYKEELTSWDLKIFYPTWLRALQRYAPDVPIIMIHNGGPTDPPYTEMDGVEIWEAEGMIEHGRGTFGHYYNAWVSMQHGFDSLRKQFHNVIFIGQNTIPGIDFLGDCLERLESADILLTFSQYHYPNGVFTEHMAVEPERCKALWQKYYDGSEMLEMLFPRWCRELNLRMTEFPNFYREEYRAKTYLVHPLPEELEKFAAARGLL